ncbi:MAG TPA: glycogen/starch synthase, partial [Gemmatimonadaceae bacterium]|nr:glycogen/starch synthase [Gemmatimonadaceae bacterium]
AVIHGVADLVPGPAVIQAHDWHAALVPVYLRADPELASRAGSVPVVLSIHNAGYQGDFAPETVHELGLPQALYTIDCLESYGRLNFLKGGLTSCTMAVTVSPTHAKELRTEEGGFGLHGAFQALGDRLVGISNGIDQSVWDPATDPDIITRFSASRLRGKATCKQALQRAMGLPVRAEVPVFGMSTRVVSQKGFDLILRSARLRDADAQFIFIGHGDPWYEAGLAALAAERPDAVKVELGFTDELEHVLMGGIDILLMPSLYEPCGLSQMRAQRYGAPVVGRRVGGISDTVEDGVTGFLFDAYDSAALDGAVDRALAAFADRTGWTVMMRQAMGREFGWDRSGALYARVLEAAAQLVAARG